MSPDDEPTGLHGFLNVIVHSASGLKQSLSKLLPRPYLPVIGRLSVTECVCCPPPDLYCTLEVDSFGFFCSKAKTRVYRYTTEPKWNEVRRSRGSGGGAPCWSLYTKPLTRTVSSIVPYCHCIATALCC